MMRFLPLFFLLLSSGLTGQAPDRWAADQLGAITWQKTYSGVLAEYHPIRIRLATDGLLYAGTLIHDGDSITYRLIGDWSEGQYVQLQERDANDRLTGYLRGTITDDRVDLEWMSADRSRAFTVRAVPDQLIRIGRFTPSAEWIEIEGQTDMRFSVQKMEYGLVSGFMISAGRYLRFEGRCQDGQCSIWNAAVTASDGRPLKISMQQRDAASYRATVDGKVYAARIVQALPLQLDRYCHRAGFLDFVYPQLPGTAFDLWLAKLTEQAWSDEIRRVEAFHPDDADARLAHRTSGWVEILDVNDQLISGLMTIMLPTVTQRAAFVWLRKEDVILTGDEWLNAPAMRHDISRLALSGGQPVAGDAFAGWLHQSGYTHTLPVRDGLVASTDFHVVYGDDLHTLPVGVVRSFVKKKYWKSFNWSWP